MPAFVTLTWQLEERRGVYEVEHWTRGAQLLLVASQIGLAYARPIILTNFVKLGVNFFVIH